MYTEKNYQTKKALKAAVAAGETVRVYQPGGIFPGATSGRVVIEGPHYPQPHRWCAEAIIENSIIVRVK